MDIQAKDKHFEKKRHEESRFCKKKFTIELIFCMILFVCIFALHDKQKYGNDKKLKHMSEEEYQAFMKYYDYCKEKNKSDGKLKDNHKQLTYQLESGKIIKCPNYVSIIEGIIMKDVENCEKK